MSTQIYDCVVVGGGPAGATAAHELAEKGLEVVLLDRGGRIKPCGGAIPPRAIKEFDIPDEVLVTKVGGARIVGPSGYTVDMPIDAGFVGMVDRAEFDEWLRQRAMRSGAVRVTGRFMRFDSELHGGVSVTYRPAGADKSAPTQTLRANFLIGADGARSEVARQALPKAEQVPFVAAYHEIIRTPATSFDGTRCDIYYDGGMSPDFYSWVFPHGDSISVGTGSAVKGFSLREAVSDLRRRTGLDQTATIRSEGAPIPLKPLKRWDNGENVVLAGDASGVVAPASGEGIYYAMLGGRLAADAVEEALLTDRSVALGQARRRFMRDHGKVFWMLGMMQKFWYANDSRRARFVSICADEDVQRLTWEAYMHKALGRPEPLTHARIFFKDIGHLLGLGSADGQLKDLAQRHRQIMS